MSLSEDVKLTAAALYILLRMYIFEIICIYVHTHTHEYKFEYINPRIHTHIHTPAHTHTHTHTRAHTHTFMQATQLQLLLYSSLICCRRKRARLPRLEKFTAPSWKGLWKTNYWHVAVSLSKNTVTVKQK